MRKRGVETECGESKRETRYWRWGVERKRGTTKIGDGAGPMRCDGSEVNVETVSGAEGILSYVTTNLGVHTGTIL